MESGSLKGTTIGEHSHCTGGHSTIKQYHERFQKNAVRWCPFFEDEKWEKFYSVNSLHLPSGNTRFMPWYSDLHVCSCLNMGHHRDVYFKINLFINFTDPCFEALISKLNVCTCESCFIFISREQWTVNKGATYPLHEWEHFYCSHLSHFVKKYSFAFGSVMKIDKVLLLLFTREMAAEHSLHFILGF